MSGPEDGWVNAAIDREGDIWGQPGPDRLWRCLTNDAGKYSLADLVAEYGPLRFADPAATPDVKTTYGLRLTLGKGEVDRVLTDVSLNKATYLVKITNTSQCSRNPDQFLTVAVISPYRETP
jgi:hypothetical protein